MICAVYARKSDSNSEGTARPIEIALDFIKARGWTLAEGCAFADNDVSGATFDRPGLNALLAAVKRAPRPFEVLVTMDGSRLGRDMTDTAVLQRDITRAGVRIFYYQTGQELILATPSDKLKASIDNFGAEDYRHQIRAKTTAALLKKFEAGHVVNGKLYGFDNVEILGASGERSHVVYRSNPQEAAVLRRIFVRYAAGAGFRKIAAELNADGVPAPKRRGAREWAASTLRDIVRNESYLGRFTYQGRTLTWPERQLIDDGLWAQVQRRRKEAAAQYLKNARGQLLSKPPSGHESRYLLSGLLECACGATVSARVFPRSKSYSWRCSASLGGATRHRENYPVVSMKRLDTAILTAAEAVLEPEVIAFRLYPMVASQATLGDRQAALEAQLATLEAELKRLGAALAAGGPLETIVSEIKAREARKVELLATRKALATAPARPPRDLAAFERRAEEVMRLGWMGIAQQHPARARALLKKLLQGRIVLTKTSQGLTFHADLHLGALAAQLGFAESLSGTVAEAPSRASECSPATGRGS